jgi:hypothetical protein
LNFSYLVDQVYAAFFLLVAGRSARINSILTSFMREEAPAKLQLTDRGSTPETRGVDPQTHLPEILTRKEKQSSISCTNFA